MITFDEAKSAIEELKKDEGLSDEKVAVVLGIMFQKGKLDVTQLDELLSIVGYELTDEFKKLPPEEQKKDENLFDMTTASDEGKLPEKVVEDTKVAREKTDESDEEGKEEKSEPKTDGDEKEEDKIARLMQTRL